jgi:pyruvate/2-oxoglutarate dehydrogenase complex dihydrolipoamide acyltransferase (E2) component
MHASVILPKIALERDTEMFVSFWFAEEGEVVFEGDRLVEILAGPVTFDVPAPASGRLVQIRAAEEDCVHCGDLLAVVETKDE